MKAQQNAPQIKVLFTKDEYRRIEEGPLKATGGRGKGSWLRQLATEELKRWEAQNGRRG